MIIVSQSQIDELTKKYGDNFIRFMENQSGGLESLYKSWRFKNWLAICFSKLEISNDLVDKIEVNIVTFSQVFRTMPDTFEAVTQREVLQTGHFGSLWTARIFVNREIPHNVMRFVSKNGITQDFQIEI